MRWIASLTLAMTSLLFAGCGEDRPPAPTAEEAEQLNQTEALLDEQAEAENRAP